MSLYQLYGDLNATDYETQICNGGAEHKPINANSSAVGNANSDAITAEHQPIYANSSAVTTPTGNATDLQGGDNNTTALLKTYCQTKTDLQGETIMPLPDWLLPDW